MQTLLRLMQLGILTPPRFYSPDDVNSTAARPEPEMEWPEGDLPEQFGGARTTLMPGIYVFQTPSNFDALWKDTPMEDTRQRLSAAQGGGTNPNYKQKVLRKVLAFDRNHPLVVVGGKNDGDVMTWRVTSNPRARGKKDDPTTPWISDLAYLLTIGMNDTTRTKTTEELKAAINAHAGQKIRLELELGAQCRGDKVRRIRVTTADGAVMVDDPSGRKGCGARYYGEDLRDPNTGKFDLEVACDCGTPTEEEIAAAVAAGTPPPQPVMVIVRAYENVSKIMSPM